MGPGFRRDDGVTEMTEIAPVSVLAITAPTDEPAWVADVLAFWFDELGPAQWFAKDAAIDARIRERFGDLHAQLAEAVEHRNTGPRERLATILVLDQFSRNLHRGDPRAFASDAVARQLADAALAQGDDVAIAAGERLFFYLPFEHSEDRADQARAVAKVEALGNAELTRYARLHQDVIERFGRFPTRNAALGRESTPAERAWLEQWGGAF